MSSTYRVASPSNIALVKYWGKLSQPALNPELKLRQGQELKQVAANSSLSMTLSGCQAITECRLLHGEPAGLDHRVTLAGQHVSRDSKTGLKIFRHLDRMAALAGKSLDQGGRIPVPVDWPGFFEVQSHNTFPTSAGIASSAAGLSALTVAAAAAMVDSADWQELEVHGFARARLADLARLGSGSAGRSVYGGFVKWWSGEAHLAEGQTIEQLWPQSHWQLCDTIAVLSGKEKAVSSTDAHKEVWTSPLFKVRLATLPQTLKTIESAIASRDIEALGEAIEQEAVNMHSVSMTAERPITFPSAQSFALMAALKTWRLKTGLRAYFTLDAGENVHIIHEADQRDALKQLLEQFVGVEDILFDHVGSGPSLTRID